MTVGELIERLGACPPEAEVRANYDVSDDTTWELYDVEQWPGVRVDEALVVVLKAK
jgi:hypothetical protein